MQSGTGENTQAIDGRLDVALEVRDLDESVRWYTDNLGATVATTLTDRSSDGTISTKVVGLRLGGTVLWLSQVPVSPTAAGRPPSMHLSLLTDTPIEESVSQLRARGVAVSHHELHGFAADADGIRRGADAEFVYLVDPDGRHVELCRPNPKQ